MTKIVITPGDVAEALGFPGCISGETCDLSADLNLPAIQRLVVRKCVEGMGAAQIDALPMDFNQSDADIRATLLAALCPTPDQGEG